MEVLAPDQEYTYTASYTAFTSTYPTASNCHEQTKQPSLMSITEFPPHSPFWLTPYWLLLLVTWLNTAWETFQIICLDELDLDYGRVGEKA